MKRPKPKLLIEQLYDAHAEIERLRGALEDIIELTGAAEMGTAAEVCQIATVSINQQQGDKK